MVPDGPMTTIATTIVSRALAFMDRGSASALAEAGSAAAQSPQTEHNRREPMLHEIPSSRSMRLGGTCA